MRNIFVLEDDGNRMKTFAGMFLEDNLVMTNNAKSAIDILYSDIEFDIIYLDHDLGGNVFVSSEDINTGAYLSKHMDGLNKDILIIIHSYNPTGASNIKQNLLSKGFKNVHVIPFSPKIFEVF